jgi:membrane protein YdbS with pleckstrin-like domain
MLNTKRQKWLVADFTILVVITGFIGTFTWTIYLNPLMLKISFAFITVFLFVFALQITRSGKHYSHSNDIPDNE